MSFHLLICLVSAEKLLYRIETYNFDFLNFVFFGIWPRNLKCIYILSLKRD